MSSFWTAPRTASLRLFASRGIPASHIAKEIGTTRQSVLQKCAYEGIDVVRDTAAEAAERDRLKQARHRRKNERRRVKPSNRPRLVLGVSKTSSIYRNQLPRIPEMTPNERRNMLAEAVRLTAAMRVE